MCKTPRSSLVGKLPPSACISSILAPRIAWRIFLQCALGKQHSPARFRLLSMDKAEQNCTCRSGGWASNL